MMTASVAKPIYVNSLFVTFFVTTDFDGPFELVQNRFFETKTPSEGRALFEWTVLDLNQ